MVKNIMTHGFIALLVLVTLGLDLAGCQASSDSGSDVAADEQDKKKKPGSAEPPADRCKPACIKGRLATQGLTLREVDPQQGGLPVQGAAPLQFMDSADFADRFASQVIVPRLLAAAPEVASSNNAWTIGFNHGVVTSTFAASFQLDVNGPSSTNLFEIGPSGEIEVPQLDLGEHHLRLYKEFLIEYKKGTAKPIVHHDCLVLEWRRPNLQVTAENPRIDLGRIQEFSFYIRRGSGCREKSATVSTKIPGTDVSHDDAELPEPPADKSAKNKPSGAKANTTSKADLADDEVGGSEAAALCLTDNCTAPSVTAPNIAFHTFHYFPAGQSSCQLARDTVVLKSAQAGRMTVLFRANYASLGRWQLYAQNIAVDAQGAMTALGERVNLFPDCTGNSEGVRSFEVTEYAEDTLSGAPRVWDVQSLERAKAAKISIDCGNQSAAARRTLDLATLGNTTMITKPFLTQLGAIGPWQRKNVYLKNNGALLSADGVALAGGLAWTSFGGIRVTTLPLATQDRATITATAVTTMAVPGTRVRLRFSVQHTRPTDLSIQLTPPNGVPISLFNRTLTPQHFQYDAEINVPSGVPAGKWVLSIYDAVAGESGRLSDFTIGGPMLASVLGEDDAGIYLRTNHNTYYYANQQMTLTELTPEGAWTGGVWDDAAGLVLFAQRDANRQSMDRWQGARPVVSSGELGLPSAAGEGAMSGVYGNYPSCLVATQVSISDQGLAGAHCIRTYDWYEPWQSRLTPVSRAGKTLLWAATAGLQINHNTSPPTFMRSCRDNAAQFRCQVYSLDLASGRVSPAKVDASALDANNQHRGFFGARWLLDRHDNDQGSLYLSTPYFQ